MFLAVGSRPDISFAVSKLSQFLESPTTIHWSAGKRVLRYLRGTKSLELTYGMKNETTEGKNLIAFSNADYASCVDTRKSISSVILILNYGPIIWLSRKQNVVATSTTDAEYIAAHDTSKETVWARSFLQEIGCRQLGPTTLYCDSKAAEALIKNLAFHKRTKHVDIKYHYVRDVVKNGQLTVTHVASDKQRADLLKPLPKQKFFINCELLNMTLNSSSGSVAMSATRLRWR
ncbi:uncharacterized protein LOC105190339 isoform X1 [Harpegnathos saltator]|uniref:uncharacterized protein LOC105190339 isoform X1 n=1 Tax=Harpegnathos saltator TaxID=610380 RepID=UPI000948B49E|nr:uncharacterized protein LOC105190339 isoform X1 [Harpegnathos saltator]